LSGRDASKQCEEWRSWARAGQCQHRRAYPRALYFGVSQPAAVKTRPDQSHRRNGKAPGHLYVGMTNSFERLDVNACKDPQNQPRNIGKHLKGMDGFAWQEDEHLYFVCGQRAIGSAT
jgi:hypothetical protein